MIPKDRIVIIDEYLIMVGEMTGTATDVMFIVITVGIITSRRFGRISKVFAMRAMKSNKIAGSYMGLPGAKKRSTGASTRYS